MVRRARISAAPRRRAPQAPFIRVMTEAEALAALEEENRLLRERLNALEELLSRTQNDTPPPPVPTPEPLGSTSNPPPPPPPPEPPLQFKEPKIGEPPTFSGKASEFRPFLAQCKLYICTKTLTFRADETRVAFIISRLRGGPAEWAHALLESGSPLLNDYDAFLQKLASIYENKERRTQLEDKLVRIQQTGAASTFAAEFMALCETLHIDPNTRMGDFRSKLKRTVREALAMLPAPTTFDELVERAVRLDHAQYTLRKPSENQNHSNPFSNGKPSNPSSSQPKNSSPSSQSSFTSQPRQAPYMRPPPASSPTPKSQGPRPPISQEERDRRKAAGLCIYCGESGHWSQQCPRLQTALKKGFARPRPNPTASSASFASSSQAPSSTPSTSAVTVLAPSSAPSHSGNPPPQGPWRQDL
jgi:Domain of unknown function (DUF4939)